MPNVTLKRRIDFMALSSAVSLDVIYLSSRMVTNQNIMTYSNQKNLLAWNYVETG